MPGLMAQALVAFCSISVGLASQKASPHQGVGRVAASCGEECVPRNGGVCDFFLPLALLNYVNFCAFAAPFAHCIVSVVVVVHAINFAFIFYFFN